MTPFNLIEAHTVSLHRKVAMVMGTAWTASIIAGLAAFAPAIFGWFVLSVVVLCVQAFVCWSAWDAGYDKGWMDHSESLAKHA